MKEDYSELLKNIPDIMKFECVWCCWKYVPNIDKTTGKQLINNKTGELEYIKKPFNCLSGYGAKSNDEKTFNSYGTVLNYLHRYYSIDEKTGKQLGGIGLGIFKGYSAIDIDHCVENGKLSEMAQDIVDYCQSYTEYSPSKTGIRIIFKTKTTLDKTRYYINNSKLGLEIYLSNQTNKFVTITGNKIEPYSDVVEVDIQYILDKYMKRSTPIYTGPVEPINREINISLNDALMQDNKLYQLWNNTAPGSHSNESELDMSLCCKLAFYLNNDETQIKEAFESSPYYNSKDDMHKIKWNGVYGMNTVRQAISYTYSHPIVQQPQQQYIAPIKDKTYELNDTGNAKRFVEMFGSRIKFNIDNNKWMLWNGKYWEFDVKNKIKEGIEKLVLEMQREANQENDLPKKKLLLSNINHILNTSGKKNLLEEAESLPGIPVLNSELDNDDFLICAQNMVYDLNSGESKMFDKSLLMSQCFSCDIDLENEPVLFNKFIHEIFEDDEEMINYMQKVLGYSISNSTREQCMWMLYGDGNNGKSLLLDVIREVVGGYGITTRPQLLTEQRNGNSNLEEVARLKGKRIIFCEEAKANDRLDESLIKSLTSGIGNVVARFLYGNSFEFVVTGKILMASNYMPNIKGTDKGIWRRIKVIPFNKDFSDVADKDLKDKLMQELPQIAGWLVKGFKKYQEEGLKEPAKVNASIKQYKEDNDIVARWIEECCDIKPSNFEKATTLFENFAAYCKRGQEYPMSQTLFGRNLGKKFKKKNYGTGIVYLGIKLKQGYEDLSKKVLYDSINVKEDI